ncbi:hypothetical protein MMC30_003895 [Trapelia coarctata]|nr:hypothetical protein [Trapelia coarctata]
MEEKALLENSSDLSSEDGLSSTHLPPLKRRQSWLGVLALHAILIIFCSVILTVALGQYGPSKENLGPGLIYTPARPVMGYEVRGPIPDTTFKLHRDPYFGDPSPELDQRWIGRLRYASIRITLEEFEHYNQSGVLLGDGSGYLATPTMYHDLHCIVKQPHFYFSIPPYLGLVAEGGPLTSSLQKYLHQTIYPDYYFPNDTAAKREERNYHTRHCLLNLAHSVTCSGDMTIRVMRWLPNSLLPSPVDHEHECRSWDRIDGWAKARAVDTAVEGMLVHPVMGPVFPGGKFAGGEEG